MELENADLMPRYITDVDHMLLSIVGLSGRGILTDLASFLGRHCGEMVSARPKDMAYIKGVLFDIAFPPVKERVSIRSRIDPSSEC